MAIENMLRTGIVDYSRQEAMLSSMSSTANLDDFNQQPTFVIIGCGGVGFWVGLFASMIGYQKFVLFDSDKVEASNLNRLPLDQRWQGKFKTLALKSLMRSMRPDISVLSISRNFNVETDMKLLQKIREKDYRNVIIVDCTDNAIIQRSIYNESKKYNYMKYFKFGYEGFTVGAYAKYDVWIKDEANYRPGYRTASANAISSAMSAGFGLIKTMTNNTNDFNMNILKAIEKGGI